MKPLSLGVTDLSTVLRSSPAQPKPASHATGFWHGMVTVTVGSYATLGLCCLCPSF